MRKLLVLIAFVLLATSCAGHAKNQYPTHWWDEVPADVLRSWEISPHTAGPDEVVLSKRNELGILSNFADTPIVFDGQKYPGLEGLWQSMKYPENAKDPRATHPGIKWKHDRRDVAQMLGHAAKKAGSLASKNMKSMGINWVSYKGKRMTYRTSEKGEHYKLIRRMMVEKIKQNPKVKDILLKTGDLKLLPDHKTKPTDPPAWKYFDIYMELRTKLQNGEVLE
jgi:predicted NAD-dependent protein-ADP-ribosyltransferase YbiA (DUF1768 family)